MALSSLTAYLAAPKYYVTFQKTSFTGNSGTGVLTSSWTQAGNPGAGSAPSNTTTGVVPTSSTTGAASIYPFSGDGYITSVEFSAIDSSTNAPAKIVLWDRVFHAGAFGVTAAGSTTLSTQPSYSTRVGSNYNGLQIFIENSVVGSGTSSTVGVTYTNQGGTSGQVSPTSVTVAASDTSNRIYRMALAAGDSGVQTIDSFDVSSAGTITSTVNVVVARYLGAFYIPTPNNVYNELRWMDRTGAIRIDSNTCLWATATISSGSSAPLPEMRIEITVP